MALGRSGCRGLLTPVLNSPLRQPQLGDGIEKPHKRPGKPRDLHIVAKGPRMVKLSWLPPVAYRGTKRTKIAYKVQFQSKRLRITWTDLFKELLISGTRITLPLSPWVDYTFRVIAADRSADSEPSEPSELYETPPAPPGRIPERIRVNGVSPTSFRVSWKTLPLLDHNGPALRYLVSWRLQNETCWKLNLWKTATVVGPMSSYVVENITSGLLYEVTVQAVNSVGQGPVSAPLHGQSLPALKDAPVLTAPVREYNASITSTIELNCPVLGAVQSRRLWYNEARIVPTKLIQHTGALLLDRVHFKDEGCYKCYAENDHGSTEGCRCLRVYGAPYTPFKLELSDKRATSVILSWTPWPSDHRPSEHFIVQYQTTFEPSIWREMIGFVPGNATKSLLELSPFVNYRFRVIAVNWVGRSDPSGASESYHTPPSAPEVFPKNIQAQGIYTRDLDVRWDPLGWYERNGPGVQYKIFWRILYCNDDLLADWESSVVQGEEKSSYIILNLIRDLPYQVQVQVLNNQGAGPISYPPVIGHAGGEGFDIVNFFEDYSGIVGTRLLITCIARGPRRMRFKWFKGEYKITASDWTRISVSPKVIRNDGDLESVLEINPTSPLDRGTYRCAVSDKGVERSCSLNITVLTKPSAQLDPVTATVLVSSPVKLTCTVRSPGGVEPQVKWFIGKDRVTDLRAISNLGNGMYRLTVLGTVEGTKYTCMASNAAGTTVAESIVTVVRKDAHDVCGQETFQNVEWGMTLAGGVYYQLCPGGSTGYATRQCLLNELDFTPYWLEPNFVQCTTYDFEALLSNRVVCGTPLLHVLPGGWVVERLRPARCAMTIGRLAKFGTDMVTQEPRTNRLFCLERDTPTQVGNNAVMEVGKVAVKGLDVIEFPATPKARTWVGTDRIEVPGKALRNLYEESQVVGVSSFLYRTIKDLLPGNDFLLSDSKIINTRVISLSLFPPPPGQLDPPVRVELAHENASFVDPECVSWDFGIQLPNRTTRGGWSTEGCAVLLSNDSHTVCQCKHLTDFAVLVTPFVPKMDAPSANEISFIVAIGCGIAMLEIASVILVYILLWRCIRCDRSVIVLNLSLSLLNANGVFLGGIPQKWNKTICTAVAAMLHYFFLAAFCWMLAEGWHMYSSLVRTNGKLSKAKLYIALGWLLPAAVVGVSLGITKTNGYGNDKQTALWSSCVILPLLAATVVLAVFAVNRSAVLFQYLFAMCNTLLNGSVEFVRDTAFAGRYCRPGGVCR
uniref:Uncharacterized protein n=1 Tax=Branchiostoma floridae TaxID=7739 RepID=C3ZCU3_BRAFL|eukprot:XP_002593585.1 hypothetical protein BRAFLDRAFT_88158 [Branchiostoma floridae]